MNSVSVVMATYNGERYIGAQLESILRQTFPPHELLISDDGSTDGTLRIVSAFAERAPFPVRVRFNSERLGYGENFLNAAQFCEGTYIAFCDQDDDWHPEKLERCVEALEREDAVLCAHTATLIDGNSAYIGFFSQGIAHGATYPALTLPPWEVFFGFTQVFRRDLLGLIRFEARGTDSHTLRTSLSHDRWIYFLALSLGKTVTLAHPLVAYRQHGKNVYGGLKKPLMVRLRGKFNGSADILRQHMTIALHRAGLMADLAATSRPSPIADQAEQAALYWRRIGETYAMRMQFYEAPSFAARLSRLSAMKKQGFYEMDESGISGWKVLMKDIALGLLRLPLSPRDPSERPAPERPSLEQPVRVEERR
ncbi:glycosyltransferase family 2 protein [Bosea lathyri]|uniref:Glycosyl transferase family 2 n=1 Tax=Bosea lathyri TaxID=1036778 RepID=A0A1H5YTN2_9HYPH|nr:glycosyltransferase family 2 protein [Bosea lathyri]SEG26666.1 Glycosyl transferase family 2 [Bosea lathyri]